MSLKSVIREFFIETALIFKFTLRFFQEVFSSPFELKETIRQSYEIGYRSLPLVGITAFILGLVIALQSRPTLVEFGAGSWLPAMSAIGIVREIGPIVTALMCAGKVGSNIGAELSSMKVTEQIDAMEVAGVNPFKFVAVTRILATTLMLPVLTVFADTLSIMGAFVASHVKDNISFRLFFNLVFEKLVFSDIVPSISKSFFFGFTIGLIGCYYGFNSKKGTEGVGRSANAAVVTSSLLIFVIDLLAVQITNIFLNI